MTDTRAKTLSLDERDRRWVAIRERMAQRGLNCLIIRGISSKWDGGTANVRYVTQIGGNGEDAMVVFPAEGDPSVLLWASSQRQWWGEAQEWVTDIRQGNPSWATQTIARISELGVDRGRIGVVGIGGRTEAGKCMSHDIYAEIREGLPDAEFEAASDIFDERRLLKSPEEIKVMTESARLCDVAIDAMLRFAGMPGVKAHEVYAEILNAVYRAGGEAPMFLMYEADPAALHALRFPSERPLEPGYILLQEILPKYAGYFSQIMVPVSVGEPHPDYRRLADAAIAAYEIALETIRPGISVKDLAETMNRPLVEAGYTWTRPQWHGTGLENVERPIDRNFPKRIGPAPEMLLEEGMILGMQPMAALSDLSKGVQVGDTVVVTADGNRRLSSTPMQLYVV
jgi:Xaa-Pro aminopeptidase